MITREFNLYLHAGHSIPLVINANQYDRGEQWLFKLFNSDGTQYVPSSGAIVGIKSDNLGIINTGSVDDQGRVVINETQQMTAAVGKAVFELVIDDGTHGTANFVVLVEPKPGDNADLSETDISMIEQAVEAASTIKPYGSPLVASTVAGMTDHEKVYVYVGSETGYTSGNWYYWDGSAWTSGGVYNSVAVQTDTTLTLSGVAADAKKTGDEISDLKSEITQLEAIPTAVKRAMDTLFQNVAFKNDDIYTDELATLHAWATAVNLISISAVFDQGNNVVYLNTPLNDLKQYLTVTANFDDGSSAEVTNYTLSGSLTAGNCSITATYEEKSSSFVVNVTDAELITLDLANPTSITPNTGLSVTDGALRIYRTDTANTTYQAANYSLPMVDGYTYKVTAYATRTLGKIMFGFRNGNGQLYGGHTIGAQTENGEYSTEIPMIPTDNPSYDGSDTILIAFFCNWSTKEKGDVTYSNIKVIKYQTPQGNS